MIRPIVKYGDPVLVHPATVVKEVTPKIHTLIDNMIDTMYAAPGVGLAASQIGVAVRIFVSDPSCGRSADNLVVMINPELVEHEGVQAEHEGCLSLPGFEATVPRPIRAIVRGLDRNGSPHEIEGRGLLARIFQHELDHLDGSLFLDHLSGLKRELIQKRVKKLRRTGDW